MLKKAEVHMLPTEGKSQLFSRCGFHIFHKDYSDLAYGNCIAQYLYFTTDEEIKESDWYMFFLFDNWELMQCKDNEEAKRCNGNTHVSIRENSRKIVATTNPELWIIEKELRLFQRRGLTDVYHTKQSSEIGKIGLDFVEAYAEAQGSIKEVMLEYELVNEYIQSKEQWIKDIHKLKLRSNGTVIIYPIKPEIYTRDEVIEIIAYRMADHRRSLNYHKTNKHMAALWKQLKELATHYLDNVYKK